MSVPVRNVYHLLSYAWDVLAEGGPAAAGAVPFRTLPDLPAAALAAGTERLLKAGLDRGYVTAEEDVRTPRGKIDLGETVKRGLLRLPAAHCHVDSLEADVPHNRAVKAGLRLVARCDAVAPALRSRCADLSRRFPGVAEVPLAPELLARVHLHRNAGGYRVPLAACRLILHSLLPEPGTNRVAFRDFLRDDRLMAALFERFVRNFYRREQVEFPEVAARKVAWADTASGSAEAAALLPEMRTDVCLGAAGRTVVVECKYYSHTLAGYYDAAKLHAPHVYQLFAYLRNLAAAGPPGRVLGGFLLYPTAGRDLDLSYTVHGHPVRVATVDLARPWAEVHARLVALARPDRWWPAASHPNVTTE